jgi:hypothetical protein
MTIYLAFCMPFNKLCSLWVGQHQNNLKKQNVESSLLMNITRQSFTHVDKCKTLVNICKILFSNLYE